MELLTALLEIMAPVVIAVVITWLRTTDNQVAKQAARAIEKQQPEIMEAVKRVVDDREKERGKGK